MCPPAGVRVAAETVGVLAHVCAVLPAAAPHSAIAEPRRSTGKVRVMTDIVWGVIVCRWVHLNVHRDAPGYRRA